MESMSPADRPNAVRRPVRPYLLLVAGFLAGSFAGAAFGVFFALSLDVRGSRPPSDGRVLVREQLVSKEDVEVISAVKAVSPSVVSVGVMKDVSKLYNRNGAFFDDFFGFPFAAPAPTPAPGGDGAAPKLQQVGGGTGFVITADGLILTNRHVVNDAEAEFEVALQDGTRHKATVLARDAVLDLAVLKIEATALTPVEFGDSDGLQIGETVIAIGNALSEYRNTVTKGVVSGVNRRVVAGGADGFAEVIEEAIQTDAAINPGNSGGPLIDLRGKVIGINTAVNREGQSLGFAIPVNAARIVVESVKANGRIVRPWIGIRYVLVNEAMAEAKGLKRDYGALISKGARPEDAAIVAGSPAEKAGLKDGDVVLEVDGVRVDLEHSLAGVIGKKRAGDIVMLKILREGVEKTVPVTLGELPQQND
jgi:serine protease Do